MVLEGFTPYPAELAREYTEKGYWQGMTVGDLLDRAVAAHADRVALVDEKGRVTYRELGERVCAYLRPRRGQTVTLEEVVSFLKEQGIASFKLPERVELIAEFPLTPVGKIAKKVLRERVARQLEEEK